MSTRVEDFIARTDGTGGGGAPGSAGLFSAVPNLAALTALVDAALINGAVVGVGTMQDVYELDKASATALSFPDVVATASGTGRWKRKFIGGQSWQDQALWFCNFTLGNDENDGSAAVGAGFVGPLKTVAEFFKRLRNGTGMSTDMLVSIAQNDTSGGVACNVDFGAGDIGGAASRIIRLQGVRTVFYPAAGTTTVSAVTPYAAVTSQPDLFTSAAIPVSWTASGLVGMLGIMTTGVATGGVFAVEFDLGAKQARVSRPIIPNSFTQVQPVATNEFQMYTCTRIDGQVSVDCTGNGIIEFMDLDVGFSGSVTVLNGSAFFYGSYVHTLSNSGGQVDLIGCLHDGTFHTLSPQGTNLDAGLLTRTGGAAMVIDQGGFVAVFNAAMVGVSAGIDVSAGGDLYCLDSLMVFNSTGAGLTVSQGANVEMGAGIALFGTTNTTYGVNVLGGGFLTYSTLVPTLTGTSGDSLIGGEVIPWLDMPFTNPDELCGIRDLAAPELGNEYGFALTQSLIAGTMPH